MSEKLLYIVTIIASYLCLTMQDTRPFMNTYPGEGQAPFVVFIRSVEIKLDKPNVTVEKKCVGTILDKNWVLTLASCVPLFTNKKNITVTANLNSYDIAKPDSQVRQVVEVITHPMYKPDKLSEADLALLQVEKPFLINKFVQPVQLENRGWPLENEQPMKQSCIVIGYGDIDFNTYDARLKTRRVLATHSDSCSCSKRNQWMSLVCLDPMEDVGLCPEDRGAPLICGEKMVALNHMLICKNNCTQPVDARAICGDYNVVSYFLYLCPYLDWIKENVPTMPSKPLQCNQASLMIVSILLMIKSLLILRGFQ